MKKPVNGYLGCSLKTGDAVIASPENTCNLTEELMLVAP